MNFRVVLVLPKTAGSAQTHKSMSFIWIVWGTQYVYLWLLCKYCNKSNLVLKLIFRGCQSNSTSMPWSTYTNYFWLYKQDTMVPNSLWSRAWIFIQILLVISWIIHRSKVQKNFPSESLMYGILGIWLRLYQLSISGPFVQVLTFIGF